MTNIKERLVDDHFELKVTTNCKKFYKINIKYIEMAVPHDVNSLYSTVTVIMRNMTEELQYTNVFNDHLSGIKNGRSTL